MLWGLLLLGGSAAELTQKPLAAQPAGAGLTLFVPLPPEQSGIVTENKYADPAMWGAKYQEFSVGGIGSGVAIGDYDGDGRPDIFVVSKTESCRLFRNLGGYKFEDVTDKAGVGDKGAAALTWKQGATFVDVNNDGRLDIYVCRFGAPNLLYINQGDGTFKESAHAAGLDVVDASGMAAFCDYDRDGWLDVYIQTNLLDIAQHPRGQRGYLFHNNRDGTFTNVTEQAGIRDETQSHSATWWDYDNDGWPDLYVANDFGTPDKLYHNNHDGTFTDRLGSVAPHTSFSSMGSDLGDVNNDGLIDFFVADMAATTHEKDQRGMADQRSRAVPLPDNSLNAPKYQRNALLLNTGTGRLLEAGTLAGIEATNWTWAVRLEDFDNDGRLDLFVTNGMNREQNNVDALTRTMAAEGVTERTRIMKESPVLAEANIAYRNDGDLHFTDVSAAWGVDHKGVSFGAATGDLSGDGNLDIVYTNYQGGVSILRNTGTSGHRVNIDLRGTHSNRFGVGTTVRLESASGIQVRQLVLARGYMSSSEPMLHFGLGHDTSIQRLVVTWPGGEQQIFTNLAVDQRFTITEPAMPAKQAPALPVARQFAEVSASTGLALLSREGETDETYLQRLIPLRLNRRGPALAVGADDSVVVGGTTLDPLRILHANAGSYAPVAAPSLPKDTDDGPVLLFDATGSGQNDLLVTRGGNVLPGGAPEYQPRLFLHGGFQPAPTNMLPPLPINAGAVAAADFDHSGRLGLFIGGRVETGQYPQNPQSALLANRGGKFEEVTDIFAPGLRDLGPVTSALWSDVDGDGWVDLLVTIEWGHVMYWHNDGGKGLEDWTERAGFAAAGTGWWTSIAAADFNGDGRLDYVVGNTGLNTQYHADATHPALLFSGDFKGDGSNQLIEAYYEGDKLYPWRSRRDLGAAIPALLKKFPRNDFYAKATLGEIFGEDKLAAAQRFAVTQLQSGVFLSQPDGTYKFEPLPRLAQIAPLQGIVAGDFDGDGHADIYAVQNSYAPIPAVGRFDGGLSQLLRGDGHGHFTAVPPNESGLVVPGDAKALVVLDLNQDGWPDFLLSRNNSTTQAYLNHPIPGRHSLRVSLKGPAGNPTGIGARVSLELADGSVQTAEVYTGSGYYSQSSPAVFFGYLDANPPKRVNVRWPGGPTSTYAAPFTSSSLVLAPQ